MKRTLGVLVTIWWLLLNTQALAERYDLSSFLASVKKNSKALELAKKEQEMALAIKKEALATAFPSISIEANYNRNLLDYYLFIDFPDFETGEMTNQKFKINFKNEFGLNAVLSQTLFSFKVGNALKAARQLRKLSDLIYDTTSHTVFKFARKAFYRTLLLEKVWEVMQASEENARENYLNMKKKYDNGQVSQFKLLQAEVRWQNIIPETTQARRNLDLAKNSLKNLAGIPVDRDLELEGDLNHIPPLPDKIVLEAVFEKRPDYNALLWEEKLKKTGLRAEKSERWPSLYGNFIYNFSALSDEIKLERQNHNFIVGLNLSIPVFTGGYREAQIRKAKIEVEKTRIKIKQAKDDIYNEIQNIYLRLKEAHQRILSGQKSLETAEKAFGIAQVSADNGLATQLELKDARLLFDRATLNVYSSVYDYLDAYFDWEQAVGHSSQNGASSADAP